MVLYRQHNSSERFQEYFDEKLTALNKSVYIMDGFTKLRSPEHSRRFMLKPSIIYTDLFEADSFSSKYSYFRR